MYGSKAWALVAFGVDADGRKKEEQFGWRPGNQKKAQTNSENNMSWIHAKQAHVLAVNIEKWLLV